MKRKNVIKSVDMPFLDVPALLLERASPVTPSSCSSRLIVSLGVEDLRPDLQQLAVANFHSDRGNCDNSKRWTVTL